MIVIEHLGTALGVVVKVLDDERVVEIDDRRQRLAVREECVRSVTLNHHDIVLPGGAGDRLRRHRHSARAFDDSAVGAHERDLMAVGTEHSRGLGEADADAGRLTVPEGLGTDEENARHPRPFRRSIIACSFHVRDL